MKNHKGFHTTAFQYLIENGLQKMCAAHSGAPTSNQTVGILNTHDSIGFVEVGSTEVCIRQQVNGRSTARADICYDIEKGQKGKATLRHVVWLDWGVDANTKGVEIPINAAMKSASMHFFERETDCDNTEVIHFLRSPK